MMILKQECTVCGNEISADANFCHHCGAGIENNGKRKNNAEMEGNGKSQIRFLTLLSLALIALVLGVYLFRNTTPSATVEPANNVSSSPADTLVGEWAGIVYKADGERYNYELQISFNGSEIRGTAITSELDASGSADAQIIGTYTDGVLNFQEYGGDEAGDWEDQSMCFWEFNLELVQTNGEDSLTGTFDAIDCQSSGTVTLYRAE